MTGPIFDRIPARYHDRIHLTLDGDATVIVDDGDAFEVPHLTDTDRAAMGLPPSRNAERIRTQDRYGRR
jgi:hypothetical protein